MLFAVLMVEVKEAVSSILQWVDWGWTNTAAGLGRGFRGQSKSTVACVFDSQTVVNRKPWRGNCYACTWTCWLQGYIKYLDWFFKKTFCLCCIVIYNKIFHICILSFSWLVFSMLQCNKYSLKPLDTFGTEQITYRVYRMVKDFSWNIIPWNALLFEKTLKQYQFSISRITDLFLTHVMTRWKHGWVFPLFSPDSDDWLSLNFHRFVILYRSCDTRSVGFGPHCLPKVSNGFKVP